MKQAMAVFLILLLGPGCGDWERHQSQFKVPGDGMQRIMAQVGGQSTPIYIGSESSEIHDKFLLASTDNDCSMTATSLLEAERFESHGTRVACLEGHSAFVQVSVPYDGMDARNAGYEVIGMVKGESGPRYFFTLLNRDQVSDIDSLFEAFD